MNKSNKGIIVVLAVVLMLGGAFFMRSMENRGIALPTAQPARPTLPQVWTKVTAPSLPVFVFEDGRLVTYAVLTTGSPMRVIGQAQGMLVVGLDDGRKAVVAPVIDGKPTTDLGDGWQSLPEVSFP